MSLILFFSLEALRAVDNKLISGSAVLPVSTSATLWPFGLVQMRVIGSSAYLRKQHSRKQVVRFRLGQWSSANHLP